MISHLLYNLALEANGIPHTDPSSATVKTIINFILGLAGAIALVIIVLSGFRYTISRGDPNSIKNAKETIIYAVVGLVIVMSAYGIVNFVFKGIQ